MTWTLRPWRMSDAGALAALLQDGRVRRMLRDGSPYPYTEADARAFLAETLASDPEEVFAFAIAQEDIPVGSLGMFRQGNIHRRTAELGYYLGPDHWGQRQHLHGLRQQRRLLRPEQPDLRPQYDVRGHVLQPGEVQAAGLL